MTTMVLIEGHEGVGKTTIAKRLRSRHGYGMIKVDASNGHNDYKDDIVVAHVVRACAPERPIVQDRSIISGLAYEPLGSTERIAEWNSWLRIHTPTDLIVIVHLIAAPQTRWRRDPAGYTCRGMQTDIDDLIAMLAGAVDPLDAPTVRYLMYRTDDIYPRVAADHIAYAVTKMEQERAGLSRETVGHRSASDCALGAREVR